MVPIYSHKTESGRAQVFGVQAFQLRESLVRGSAPTYCIKRSCLIKTERHTIFSCWVDEGRSNMLMTVSRILVCSFWCINLRLSLDISWGIGKLASGTYGTKLAYPALSSICT